MSDTSLATVDLPMSLDPIVKANLQTWEDFLSYYLRLHEASNSFSWIKADLLQALTEKFGEKSIEQIAREIGEPSSTIKNYVKTAKAFPVDKRSPSLSFSHHFQAARADEYDSDKEEFTSAERFKWLDKAADNNLSTRALQEEIMKDKETKELMGTPPNCDRCKRPAPDGNTYVFYAPGTRKQADRFFLHEHCYLDVKSFILGP